MTQRLYNKTVQMLVGLAAVLLFFAAAATPVGAASSIVRIEMPVPAVTIYPGDPLTEDLITMRRMRMRARTLPSFHRSPNALVGKVARRTLIAGRPIPVNALRAPSLVKEGDHVALIFEVGGLTIKGSALALQDGSRGQVIGLRNLDSGVTVRGRVVQAGIVTVGNETCGGSCRR